MNNKKLIHRRLLVFTLIIIALFSTKALLAQETVVVGQVLNIADKTPISSASIYFKNTTIGVKSNDEGYFLIRTTGKESTLIFSSIGYKQHEIKVKPGKSVGVEVQLNQENTLLQEVFVVPGSNPAMEWMKKIRYLKKENDVTQHAGFKSLSTEQNLVLLSKISQRATNKRIFEQLKKGNISNVDSSLVIPLYMAENTYQITASNKIQLSKNIFSSSETGERISEKLVGEISVNLNFYNNAITVFGKSMVSPLSNIGNAFYDYFLADSLQTETGKQYEIHFRSKNTKNLAFNGQLWFDSTTLALTRMEAELPTQANINFIHNLRISQHFEPFATKQWIRSDEELTLNMTYELLADSLHPRPEIFIKRSAIFRSNDSISTEANTFAQSNYNQAMLSNKLNELNNTPLLRSAKWVADIILTGYIPMGKIDLGKVQQLARISDIEGFRFNVPLRTSEKLWKNISLGGYVGYGFKNKEINFSGGTQFRLPGDKKRILSANYCNDYRIINYDYNNFIYHENPLVTGDEDIANTLLAFRSADRMNKRKEFSLSFSNDWNSDIETNVFLRSNQLFANDFLPMTNGSGNVASLQQQSATLETRFSFGEKTYEDHMQRIYIANNKPVFYSILEAGNYKMGNKSGNYGKIAGAIKQNVRMDFGQFSYIAEASCMLGKVPYPLLQIPFGNDTGGYGFHSFNLMQLMEYATDKYVNFHSELTLNGLILNQIPVIKKLNLRELCSFHMAYGSLSDTHKEMLAYPTFMQPLSKPYMEVGVGLTNILHLFAVQSVWRLTDLNKPNVKRWGLLVSLSLGF